MAQLITLKGKNGDYFVVRDDWDEMDFHGVADSMGEELTREQLELAMRIAARTRDCNVGINWDFIRSCIEKALEG
jgi:hypothetical protein